MTSDLPRSVYSCRIPVDGDPAEVLQTLAGLGVAADHWVLEEGELRLALHSDQIERVRGAGLNVTVGEDLRERAAHVQRSVALPIADSGDAGFQKGFVSAYLDTAELYAQFATLVAAFPALCTWADLPEWTAGYDGSEPGLGGPSAVKLLRIRSAAPPVVRPGLLVLTAMHAREWVLPSPLLSSPRRSSTTTTRPPPTRGY